MKIVPGLVFKRVAHTCSQSRYGVKDLAELQALMIIRHCKKWFSSYFFFLFCFRIRPIFNAFTLLVLQFKSFSYLAIVCGRNYCCCFQIPFGMALTKFFRT